MNILTFTHLGKVPYSELPIVGESVTFEKTKMAAQLKGVWKFLGTVEAGMAVYANFVCEVSGNPYYKVGHHICQTADLFE